MTVKNIALGPQDFFFFLPTLFENINYITIITDIRVVEHLLI